MFADYDSQDVALLLAPRHILDLKTPHSPQTGQRFGVLRTVDAICASFPDQIAIRHGTDALSYAELDHRSKTVARWIKEFRLEANLVGLHLRPSIERIVMLLGVLRAGCGYLPLDPQYPLDRLQLMIRSARPDCVIADSETSTLGDSPTFTVDEITGPRDSDAPPASGELGYVIFTSGSTGTPKGIEMPLSVLDALVEWQLQRSAAKQGDRTLQFTPLSFDVSFQEIFATLCSGGTLVVADESDRRDSLRLIQLINRHAVQRIFLPFVALNALAETSVATSNVPASLREVITAGEQLKVTPATREFARRIPGLTLDNQYGPAETHVVTAGCLQGNPEDWPDLPSIGHPLPHVSISIVDGDQKQVLSGNSGELWIGGGALAHGYRNNSVETEKRFIRIGTDRWYRTGDEVKQNSDGSIQWLSRLDSQIKVAGVRVEPGEVEVALTAHPQIQEAVVTAVKNAGVQQLAAYFIVSQETTEQLAHERVSAWNKVWDDTYANSEVSGDTSSGENSAQTDSTGWRSSFTGLPIDKKEMASWADSICDAIGQRPTNSVIEIGAGTGMIALRLARHAKSYVATDLSPVATAALGAVAANDPQLSALRCVTGAAHELMTLNSDPVDTVVLNSVTQHFPSAQYLVSVITESMRRLSPGGQLFIGDVFHHGLTREYFHRVAEAHGTGDAAAADAARLELLDQELRIHPSWFMNLPYLIDSIDYVSLEIERGPSTSEMACFRFHAIAVKKKNGERQPGARAREVSLQDLEVALRASNEALRISGLSNLRTALSGDKSVDPQDIWSIAERHQATVRLAPSLKDPHRFDAFFREGPYPAEQQDSAAADQSLIRQWTTHPLAREAGSQLEEELRNHLKHRLPAAAVPEFLVAMPTLPLTASGKLDRRRLPEPLRNRPKLAGAIAPPQTQMQIELASIWKRLLGLREVGIDDPFFDVGGNSLVSMKLFVEICDKFKDVANVLQPYQLLEFPTIRRFCDHLSRILEPDPGVSAARRSGARQRAAFRGRRR